MINYLAEVIERIMKYISPAEVSAGEISYNYIPLSRLKKICYALETHATETALEKRLEYLSDWVVTELSEERRYNGTVRTETGESAVCFFDLLDCFTMKVLTTVQGEIVFRYRCLEPWHNLSGQIGTDLLVVSAYVYHDYKFAVQRTSFLWKSVLNHDNYVLNTILNKGISDNHYHLHGSTPYFDLSWISLMNSVTQNKVANRLDQMEGDSRIIRTDYRSTVGSESYNLLHLKAALIRLYLYTCLTGSRIRLGEYRVPAEWILRYILETEEVGRYVKRMQDETTGRESGSSTLRECMEPCTEQMDMLKQQCPGFYRFFWEEYPEIPVSILANDAAFICAENISVIARYIETQYGNPLLEDWEWMFRGSGWQKYCDKWDQVTQDTLRELLADQYKLLSSRQEIQRVIDGFHNHNILGCKDYALNEVASWTDENWERAVISGERWLLYEMIYSRYSKNRSALKKSGRIYNLFFMYLLIKETFRQELLQNNGKIGFDNFQAYQRRKNWFTTSFSEGELAKIAVKEAFKNSVLNSLELRIVPKDRWTDNINTIKRYDRAILDKWKEGDLSKYYYVYHFKKEKDMKPVDGSDLRYRYDKYRRQLKQKTDAILMMRSRNARVGVRLKGVDACSSEDGCRPEVFAVAFRVLKNHIVEHGEYGVKVPQLRVSYHVGEDNQDVLDGLRAIDEAVYFLNLRSGDRLGHATMLGVDIEEWYYRRGNKISICQQDYLDNVVWLYERMIHYHISNQDNLLEYLESEFQTYFERIYREALSSERGRIRLKEFDIHNYYAAWELRGDHPALYKSGKYERNRNKVTIWDDHAINRLVEGRKRDNEKTAVLHWAYQYSSSVRKEGAKSIVKELPVHMIQGIAQIQHELQREITKHGIAIETNPSSNVMISNLGNYGDHPITAFYNKGLTNDIEQLEHCPQINVSINTDDLGVFMTCLHNEYTLMAKALESMKDKAGNSIYKKDMVYDWINHIRKMGNNQPFSRELFQEDR